MCDGFTGNMALKVLEGTVRTVLDGFREEVVKSQRGKVGALMIRPAARSLQPADPDTYGGAYLLGLKGLATIAHGNSSRRRSAARSSSARGASATQRDRGMARELSDSGRSAADGCDTVSIRVRRDLLLALQRTTRGGQNMAASREEILERGQRRCSSSSSKSMRAISPRPPPSRRT